MDMSFNQPGTFAPAGSGAEIGIGHAAGLRPMSWHELCARIAAVQDLRRVMASISSDEVSISTGSFHGQAARIIASGFSGVPAHLAEGEGIVNPTSSANGKAKFGTTSSTDGRSAVGPR